jgi:hypothetical protein
MVTRRRTRETVIRWLYAIGVVAAFISQLTVAFSPLVEAREGQGFGAHVEQGGTSSHYAHNDATCVTCQARTLTGPLPEHEPVPAPTRIAAAPIPRTVAAAIAADVANPKNPRAPPSKTAEV